jgi:hypothetical protein
MSIRRLLNRVIQKSGLAATVWGAAQAAGTIEGVVIDRITSTTTQPTGVVAYTAANNAAGVYLSGNVQAEVGAASGAPTSFTVDVKLQHGDKADGTDMADAGIALTQLSADNTNTAKDIDMVGLKRYIRAVATVAFVDGTTPKIPVNVKFVLGDPTNDPAN